MLVQSQRRSRKTFFIFGGFLLLLFLFSFKWDASFHQWLVEWQSGEGGVWLPLLKGLSRYGDWPELMLLGLLGFLMTRLIKHQKSQYWGKVLLVAMLASTLSGATVNILRLTTGRTRPRVTEVEQGWYGPYTHGRLLIGKADFNSFPSGHTATAIGFALILFFANSYWGSLALLIAFGVAGSRLLLAAHHPSDIIGAIWITWIVTFWVWSKFQAFEKMES